MRVKVIRTFATADKVSGVKGEIIDINNTALADNLVRAGHVEPIKAEPKEEPKAEPKKKAGGKNESKRADN